jgi:cyclophilin family peptidyl-prolyl cis-trans isomerase
MIKKLVLILGLAVLSSANTIVMIETNQGNIELELFDDKAPKTVENFNTLIQSGYYKGVIFHRVIPNFMIQGGDPTGTGRGGTSIWGTQFEDEINNEQFNTDGILAMANAGPNTNGSQFFITTAPTPWLNGQHTIFGRVKSGMNIVHKIENTPSKNTRPIEDQVITNAFIVK